jgi:septal ring factor EnvC (AmiA/AmiB activator)
MAEPAISPAPVASRPPLAPIAGTLLPGVQLPGGPADGLTIVSGIGRTVSAPVAGRVAFAAPFRGFGLLLIIDDGRGYHVVLSGITQLDVRQGASVVAGQATGEIAALGDAPARLYVELRYRGLPVDPAPWLAAHQDKVRS